MQNRRCSYIGSASKRIVDLTLAALGMVLFAPVHAVIALAIVLDDRGPVFFHQQRVGYLRRTMGVLKFRTMNSGRVTRVGRWLRATGLDESAQFVNVLRGEMSMVGPRPLTRADLERLGWTGLAHEGRFQMTPGITGIAQLLGGREARQSYRLDILYSARASALFDLWLVFVSFMANVVGKRRARAMLSLLRSAARAAVRATAPRNKKAGAASPDVEPPFRSPMKRRRVPAAMSVAPRLPPVQMRPPRDVQPRTALLINPFYAKDPHASFGKHVLTPTLALTSIAGTTPADWTVAYWDENLLKGPPPADPVPQVVGISAHLTFAERAYELAKWYRQLGAKVVLGGLHVLSCPDEAAQHADAIAIGDGVPLWPRILADVGAGALKRVYQASFTSDYRTDPAPARDILPRRHFLTTASINATRGCHNRCGFCYLSTQGLRMPYRTRDVQQIVDEIRKSGEPYAVFTDNNLGSDRTYLKLLCQALQPLEIIWSAAVTIDVTDDPELIREMALAGCTGVFIGFESLSDKNLQDARKKTPRPDDYARRVALLHDNGIQVNGSFVFGFDDDQRDVFARTVAWIEQARLESATFHILTPYPGTPQFADLEAQGRLLHKDWRLYDTAHAVFRPTHMTPSELEQGYRWTYERLFSMRSIWHRRPSDWRAVAPYLAMAYLYKRSNWLWHLLIKYELTRAVWSPLVELTRRRNLRFRCELAKRPVHSEGATVVVPRVALRSITVISGGV